MHRLILLAAVAAGIELGADPSPLPSGMDLLYSDRLAFRPNGEPIVAIGLMSGQDTVRFHSASPLRIDFYEAGVHKQTVVPPGRTVTVRRRRGQAATKRHYVDLEGFPFADRQALEQARRGWIGRGYPTVEIMEEGTVLGIGGRVLDNRSLRLVVPTASPEAAAELAHVVYTRFGHKAVPRYRLAERPWGELEVTTTAGWVGLATSYVRAVPQGGIITVDAVEHGRGYAWHGHETRGYRGELYAAVDPSGKLAAVNVLGAEDVLKGVVPSELFASAPPEALKAQAVAARNHLLAKLGRRHHGDPFHLCSEQHCQVYTGVTREDPRTNAAVEETNGQALFHQGLVHAVYSSTCGGYTEDNDVVWGDKPDPALRARPDFDPHAHPKLALFAQGLTSSTMPTWVEAEPATYCARASFARPQKFRWEQHFTAAELREILQPQYGHLGELRDVRVRERGTGGKVVSLELRGARGSANVVLELTIRRLFNNLNSGAFVVHPQRNAAGQLTGVTFRGGGWGHGVGMCQMGAIGRAEAGHSYRDILGHYYNGARLEQIYGGVTPSTRQGSLPSPAASQLARREVTR